MNPFNFFSRRSALKLAGTGLFSLPGVARAASLTTANKQTASRGKIWIPFFDNQKIWAYTNRESLLAGDPLSLMLSAGPGERQYTVRAEFFRIGANGDELVLRSDPTTVEHFPVDRSAAASGASWTPALADLDTSEWPAGCYSIDIVHEKTGIREVQAAQFILRNRSSTGTVLLRLGTNTYQAYNAWGGHSFYPSEHGPERGSLISFDRPCAPSFFEYDVYMVRWLEAMSKKHGFKLDFASNFDVHHDPKLLSRYKLVITGSHDEYWSREEFDAFEQRIYNEGGNTAFFGANTAYFQVRYADINRPPDGEDWGRQLVCHKGMHDPITTRNSKIRTELLATTQFRENSRRPETILTGGAYQGWFKPDSSQHPAYKVSSSESFLFEGTGLKNGDTVAKVIGYEWDNRDPDGDGKMLFDIKGFKEAQSRRSNMQVLMRGDVIDVDGKHGIAEAIYFTSHAGAKVFNAGTVRWAWGLGKEGFTSTAFQKFNENLVQSFIA